MSPGPEALAIAGAEARRVHATLVALPEIEAQVLILVYFGGFTQVEIAGQLAVPLGTVKSRTLRALRRLGHLLTADGPSVEA